MYTGYGPLLGWALGRCRFRPSPEPALHVRRRRLPRRCRREHPHKAGAAALTPWHAAWIAEWRNSGLYLRGVREAIMEEEAKHQWVLFGVCSWLGLAWAYITGDLCSELPNVNLYKARLIV